jgi:hypothetical protein
MLAGNLRRMRRLRPWCRQCWQLGRPQLHSVRCFGERAVCATFDNRERSARHAFRYTNTQQAGFVFVAQKNLWLYRLD